MNYCGSCGAALGVGRFCTNCGAPIRTDEPVAQDRAEWAPPPAPGESRTARRPVLWLGVVVLLLLLTVVVVWLTTGDDGRPSSTAASESAADQPPSADDLAPEAQAAGPAPLPPGQDLAGRRVDYPLTNLLDGDPSTAYRTAGDATGSVLTFTLPREAEIREVGLVNGYAKTDSADGRAVSWYELNRRVMRVAWTFDDGTTLEQELRSGTDMQTIAVDGVRTRTVELRLLEVSAPGTGPLRKDVTAIGDVLLRAGS